MNSVVDTIDWLVHGVFLAPFYFLAREYALILVSFVAGLIFLLIYGKVSNQAGIRKLKSDIYGYVLESVLFRHDLRNSLSAQRNLFISSIWYFLYAFPPILVLAIPCLLILAQLNLEFNNRGLLPGESALLGVTLQQRNDLYNVKLEATPGLEITPALHTARSNQVFWRVTLKDNSPQTVKLKVDGHSGEIIKPIKAASDRGPASSYSTSQWWWKLFYPDNLFSKQKDGIKDLSFTYPEQRYTVLGIKMHWLVIFLIFSILSGIFGSKLFGVEI